MEFSCDICGLPVYAFGGMTETRCLDCQAVDTVCEDAEGAALRELLQDSHEMGRGTPPVEGD